MTRAWRSAMFVPAHDEGRLAKAHTRGADVLILDLEDAVPEDRKADARRALGRAVDRLTAEGQDLAVRINAPWRLAHEDLAAAIRPGVRAIVVPKVECPGRLKALSEMVAEWEPDAGLSVGDIALLPLVESPAGLAALQGLAVAPRVCGLALGPEDFAAALGAAPTRASLDLPCQLIALAASARGLMALGAPVSIADYGSLELFTEAAAAARAMGMTGALCVHPAQAGVLNAAFMPSEEELADARRVLAAWGGRGGSGVVAHEGRMIDAPVAARAERTLARARA